MVFDDYYNIKRSILRPRPNLEYAEKLTVDNRYDEFIVLYY